MIPERDSRTLPQSGIIPVGVFRHLRLRGYLRLLDLVNISPLESESRSPHPGNGPTPERKTRRGAGGRGLCNQRYRRADALCTRDDEGAEQWHCTARVPVKGALLPIGMGRPIGWWRQPRLCNPTTVEKHGSAARLRVVPHVLKKAG